MPLPFNFKAMYRVDAIKDKFIHLLGWRQHYNTDEFSISEDLTKSETGQYFQDIHPLVTLDSIYSIIPEFAQAKTEGEDYNVLFSKWLEQKTMASILKVIERFYSEKLADNAARNIIESKVLFDGAGRLADVVRNSNSIVGFEIIPIRAQGVTLKIEKIGLQFNKPGKFNLYLMHTSNPEPIKTIQVDYTKNGGVQWINTDDLYLPYMSDDTDAGGSWFLCYNQNDLPEDMQAIQKNRDWSQAPCRTCNRLDYINWQAWSQYLEIHPFRVPAPDTMAMWDVQDNIYTYQTNYGINLKVTMECDITDILIDQRRAFQNVIGLQVAADMIREFAYNPSFRINRMQQNFSRNELLYELDGDSQGYKKSGILYRLDKAMEALQIDTTGINRICLPCNNDGIYYRTT